MFHHYYTELRSKTFFIIKHNFKLKVPIMSIRIELNCHPDWRGTKPQEVWGHPKHVPLVKLGKIDYE